MSKKNYYLFNIILIILFICGVLSIYINMKKNTKIPTISSYFRCYADTVIHNGVKAVKIDDNLFVKADYDWTYRCNSESIQEKMASMESNALYMWDGIKLNKQKYERDRDYGLMGTKFWRDTRAWNKPIPNQAILVSINYLTEEQFINSKDHIDDVKNQSWLYANPVAHKLYPLDFLPNLASIIDRGKGSGKISMSPIWAVRGTKNQKGYPILASCGDFYFSSNGEDELFNSLNDKQKTIFLINDPILKQTYAYCTFVIDWHTKNNKTIRSIRLKAFVAKSENNAPKSLKNIANILYKHISTLTVE